MAMAVKRLVIVADQHDLADLTTALIKAGVKAKEIYVSADHATPYLRAQGVNVDLPVGQIRVSSFTVPDANSICP
jgi:hypothetical protein